MPASPDQPVTDQPTTVATSRPSAGQLGLLRGAALVTAVGAFLQLLLGGYQFTAHNPAIGTVHVVVGLVTLIAGIVATIAAFINKTRGGNPGLAFHVLGTTVLILVQYGLGEMMSSFALVIVHMVLGLVILLSAIGMATLAYRKPLARR